MLSQCTVTPCSKSKLLKIRLAIARFTTKR